MNGHLESLGDLLDVPRCLAESEDDYRQLLMDRLRGHSTKKLINITDSVETVSPKLIEYNE